ncbi:hypothetical protein IG631_09260 [Alternaria alternata]|nr:hypothetical protein IG631_09260 [Alternaria alternata]
MKPRMGVKDRTSNSVTTTLYRFARETRTWGPAKSNLLRDLLPVAKKMGCLFILFYAVAKKYDQSIFPD